jgi:hypothetical protein
MPTGAVQVILVSDDGSCNPSKISVMVDTEVIIWAMAAGSSQQLNGVTINAPWSGPQPASAVLNGATIWAVGDNDNVTQPTAYKYNVLVGDTWHDPEIDNLPPTP